MITIHESSPSEGLPQRLEGSTRLRWFELCLVLMVAFGYFFLSSLSLLGSAPATVSHIQGLRYIGAFFQEVVALLLLGYVLLRQKRRLADFGLRLSLRDIVTGLVVAVVSYVAYIAGSLFVHLLYHVLFASAPKGISARALFAHPSALAIPFFLLNPFFEEMVVRAYLMTEVKDLTGSWILACLLSLTVQTSYHLYYGWVGALGLSFSFLVFSIYYAKTKNATPIIVAHAIFDLYALIRLW